MRRLSERDLRLLVECVDEVAARHDPESAQAAVLGLLLFFAQQESAAFAEHGLTKRERELLLRATHGETNGEIAQALRISHRTVAKHLEHAYAKLGVHGRREAARFIDGE